MTFDDIPGAPRASPSGTARAISLAFTAKDCLTQIDAIAHGNVSTAHAAGELFRSDVELAVGCLGEQWNDAYGITGFIGQFIVSVALWLADGIKLVLNGLQAAIDTGILLAQLPHRVVPGTRPGANRVFAMLRNSRPRPESENQPRPGLSPANGLL